MSTDFEELLRSEMAAVEVRSRPGLVRKAYRACQRRRRVTRAVAAAGTAAVTAGGTAVGLGTAGSGTGNVPAETTAYVVSHVTSALGGSGEIAYTYAHTTVDGPPGRPFLDTRSWTYGNQTNSLSLTPAGKPYVSWAETMTSNGYVHQVGVNYQARTYTRQSWKSPPASETAPSGVCALSKYQIVDVDLTSDPRAQVEAGLRCGVFTLAGHQRIDGIDALKLVDQVRSGGTPWMTLNLWVDPATYLPIETQLDTHGHLGGGLAHNLKGGIVRTPAIRYITVMFSWLPPTRANLALLSPPIPAGYRQVSEEP